MSISSIPELPSKTLDCFTFFLVLHPNDNPAVTGVPSVIPLPVLPSCLVAIVIMGCNVQEHTTRKGIAFFFFFLLNLLAGT
jgi:hypothetical protein